MPMKIAFIRPNMYAGRSSDAMEPLCFAILKGLTPPDVETVLYDERLEEVPLDETCDLVAMTVETYTARRAYAIADRYRSRGIPVVMGGYHPTFLPEEAARHADAVVVGDAEGIWPRVVEEARAGRLSSHYKADGFADLAGAHYDRSIFAGKKYAPVALVQYSRGCKFNCDFCSIRAFYGANLRQRPVDELVAEIAGLGQRHIFFVDDNIFINPKKAKELFRALIPLKIRWSCQVSIDIVKDPELLPLMKASGCATALIGFESLDAANLKQMNKGWNQKFASYEQALSQFADVGIMIYGTFVFGYDHDTPASFDAAVDFARQNRFWLANFNPLTPTPGAPLHDRLIAEGRMVFNEWWLDPNFRYGDATFEPRAMTASELTEGCFRARRAFNTWGSLIGRFVASRTNAGSPYRAWLYWLGNLVSRYEIYRKQGRALGGEASPDSAAR
ncbi:B12-binding domain-containing radical SAM protein [Neoroseomonas oryzicola]|nr:radical SAM protein [Neoroseomonas oryzicola]